MSIFFTSLITRKEINAVKKYAEDHGLTYVTIVYNPKTFTDTGNYEGTDVEKFQFQKDFSAVYAENTKGTAYLMMDLSKKPKAASIFYSVEFPAMVASGEVDKVVWLDINNKPDDPTSIATTWWKKGETIPPAEDAVVADGEDDVGSPEESEAPPPPPPYATGTCHIHINEYETCADDSKNLQAEVILNDNAGTEIGYTPVDRYKNLWGSPINDKEPYGFTSKLPLVLVIIGQQQNDYVQFAYSGLSWTSRTKEGLAYCNNGGWDLEVALPADFASELLSQYVLFFLVHPVTAVLEC